jgi:hypothetical protein
VPLRYLLAASLLLAANAFAGETCAPNALQILKSQKSDAELRSSAGACLVTSSLGKSEVAHVVLNIIRNGQEDLFLREDLIEALSNAPLRHTVQVHGDLAPQLGKEDKENLDRTLASRSASSLMAVAQAVKSMDEILPVTRLEGEFFHALSEIAQEDSNHIVLREAAVGALEKMSMRVVSSGVYEEKALRLSQETLRIISSRDDFASYYSGAGGAYDRLATAKIPGYMVASKQPVSNRVISSIPAPVAK